MRRLFLILLRFLSFGITFIIRLLVKLKILKRHIKIDIDGDGDTDISINFHSKEDD